MANENYMIFWLQPQEKKGVLNKAKIQENGKKLKKNWSSCFAITSGCALYLYKDQKASVPKEKFPHGKPETIIDLAQATIEHNAQKSSKKYVLQVSYVFLKFVSEYVDFLPRRCYWEGGDIAQW